VFTVSEILSLVEAKGLPEEDWETNLPGDLAPYIEAQVWNHEPLAEYRNRLYGDERSKRDRSQGLPGD
jgi:hypothetical protein